MEVRRVRDSRQPPSSPLRQAFLWAGDVLVEVAGPAGRRDGDGPARLWGRRVRHGKPRDARRSAPARRSARCATRVQPGRRIATLRREAGSSVPIAFMTPHQRPHEPVS